MAPSQAALPLLVQLRGRLCSPSSLSPRHSDWGGSDGDGVRRTDGESTLPTSVFGMGPKLGPSHKIRVLRARAPQPAAVLTVVLLERRLCCGARVRPMPNSSYILGRSTMCVVVLLPSHLDSFRRAAASNLVHPDQLSRAPAEHRAGRPADYRINILTSHQESETSLRTFGA